ERYAARMGEATDRDRAWFGGLFPDPATSSADPGTSVAEGLLTALDAADSRDALLEVASGMDDLWALVDAWPALVDADERLAAQLRDTRSIDPDAAAFARAEELLAHRPSPFRSSLEAKV